jgi:hypothetical protein
VQDDLYARLMFECLEICLCISLELTATCELRWDFLEEERMMQYSRDKYFPQLRTKVINPVGEPHRTSLATPTHKSKYLHPTQTRGLSIPFAVTCKD